MKKSKLLIIACGVTSIDAYATTITLTGVISQPASRAGYFIATNSKSYCFGDCIDDRVGEKMIDVLTKAGCSSGLDDNANNDSNCIIKVKLNKKQDAITKVISAKKY